MSVDFTALDDPYHLDPKAGVVLDEPEPGLFARVFMAQANDIVAELLRDVPLGSRTS